MDTRKDVSDSKDVSDALNELNDFQQGIIASSTPKVYPNPKPLMDNASNTETQLHNCKEVLHHMENELMNLEQVIN